MHACLYVSICVHDETTIMTLPDNQKIKGLFDKEPLTFERHILGNTVKQY